MAGDHEAAPYLHFVLVCHYSIRLKIILSLGLVIIELVCSLIMCTYRALLILSGGIWLTLEGSLHVIERADSQGPLFLHQSGPRHGRL